MRPPSATLALDHAPVEPLEFEAVYETWFAPVCRWLRALGAPERDLDDLAQDVFTVVHRKLAGFDGRNLPAWLYVIARRTLRDHRRRAWFRALLGGEQIADDRIPGDAGDPETALAPRRERERFWRLVRKLDERHRVTLVLFEIEGYSGEEIAGTTGVPLATVWTRLHHARKRLAALLEDER